MHHIVLKPINRREVHAAAKPADRCAIGRLGGEHAHIHVGRRRKRIARVKHQRHAQRLKARARQLGAVLRRAGRQARASHMRKAYARTLKHRPAFQNLGDAVSLQGLPGGFGPGVDHKAATVQRGDGAGQALLQIEQVIAHIGSGGGKHGLFSLVGGSIGGQQAHRGFLGGAQPVRALKVGSDVRHVG